jgi:hypothetical protein
MRGPCYSKEKNIDNPFEAKWYNCKYDGEPMPLGDEKAIQDFKELCSPLYAGDDTPVCCAPNQLAALKKDLQAAEAVGIGSCSSCYFNFRMLWCYMACHQNQSEFIVPTKLEYQTVMDFDKYLNKFKLSKHSEDKETDSNDSQTIDAKDANNNKGSEQKDKKEEDPKIEEEVEEAEDENEHSSENESLVSSTRTTSESIEDKKRKKRSAAKRSAQVVNLKLKEESKAFSFGEKEWAISEIEFHLKESHLQRLVDACR